LFKRSSVDVGTTWGSALGSGTAASAGTDGSVSFGAGNGITSFSQIITGGNGTPLPVELISFSAIPLDNKEVLLKWETAAQLNNDYFTVEKSQNGEVFEGLLKVPGIPWSNSIERYEEVDQNPYPGLSYYRLKSTDIDGAYDYSQVVAVDLEASIPVTISPNPIGSGHMLNIVTGTSENVTITLYNEMGHHVWISRVFGSGQVPLTNLRGGIYTYRVATEKQLLQSGKLVVTE